MPFVILIIALALVVSGVRGTQAQLASLLKSELTGANSFVPWLVALTIIGGLGYVKPIKPIADSFLILVILVLFLSNSGFFAKFIQQTGIKIGGTV